MHGGDMDGLVWYGQRVGADQGTQVIGEGAQSKLLEAALVCGEQGVKLHTPEKLQPAEPPKAWPFAIAVGAGSIAATSWLATTAALRLARRAKGPALHTLVLVIPGLSERYFLIKDKPYEEGALVLEAVSRVVVLLCGRDSTVVAPENAPVLGRLGPVQGSDTRVHAIDISPLIEQHADAVRGVLCSCEAVGLIRRLAQGVAVDAALLGRARLVTRGGS